MNISNRLKTIASFINRNSSVFDVGADHGLLDAYLLNNNLVEKVVAVENKQGPYSSIKKVLSNYPNATALYSDGLNDLNSDSSCLILAGLGGHTIVDILYKNVDKLQNIEQIVVDAHRDTSLVRKEIIKLGYHIEKEKIVYENHIYYFVISFLKGIKEYNDDEIEFGYRIKEDKLFEQYKNQTLEKLYIVKQKTNDNAEVLNKIRRLENL